jgi:tetratricopeptide (TPR) repeat protein
MGDFGPAREQAKKAVAQSDGSQVEAMAALTFALTGDKVERKKLISDLNERFPKDTIVQLNYLPSIRAAAALPKEPAKALQAITPAQRYELGYVGNGADFNGYPIYFRGEALLANHRATEAAAAFQKIIDHPGIVFNEPIAVLAYLGLGRAYAEEGDTTKAKAAYTQFLTLWKDADPGIPVHAQAKAEYAALQHK